MWKMLSKLVQNNGSRAGYAARPGRVIVKKIWYVSSVESAVARGHRDWAVTNLW